MLSEHLAHGHDDALQYTADVYVNVPQDMVPQHAHDSEHDMAHEYIHAPRMLHDARLDRRQATATTTVDPCMSLIGSTFATNTAIFCSGWLQAGTTQYVAPAFQTACASSSTFSNPYARITSACNVINNVASTPTASASADPCVNLVKNTFPTNSVIFCIGWGNGGPSASPYIAPQFSTTCSAVNVASRISSACSVITSQAGVAATATALTTTTPIATSTPSTTAPAIATSSISTVAAAVSVTTSADACVALVKNTFPTNYALFCNGWFSGGTTQYVAPVFQTSCGTNSYSRISSACTQLVGSGSAASSVAAVVTPTSDACVNLIKSSFPTNSALFCSGWNVGGTTQYVGPAFQTTCSAANSYSRITSACNVILSATATATSTSAAVATTSKTSTQPGVTLSTTSTPTTSQATTTGPDQCIACVTSSFPTNSALFCSGWLAGGTTQYVAPAFVTSCTGGNVYSKLTSACNAILSPASNYATASATTNLVCTTTASFTQMVAKSAIVVPKPTAVALHGASNLQSNLQVVPNQYAWNLANPPPSLPAALANALTPNSQLITNYPLYTNGTGALTVNAGQQVQKLDYQPNLSRDAGKGGVLCGQKMFIFADTGISTPVTGNAIGTFEGFVSNSVATDVGLNGAFGKALTLADGIGEWASSNGNMRGFISLTQGEVCDLGCQLTGPTNVKQAAYNAVNEGNGQRYAIWPKSSIIPLTSTTAILYSPIIFCNVNYNTGIASYPLVGVTLTTITNPGVGGPISNRIAPLLWGASDVEWGTVGGIRSWGPSGPGGSDGMVYLFGQTAGGLLLAKVAPANIGTLSAYTYYNGAGGFTSTVPTVNSTAYIMTGAFSTLDIFYSPRHQTFIMVYQSYYADNQFHWRYLMADHGIIPGYAGGADADYVANIYKYQWSPSQLLFNTTTPPSGYYTYGGGAFSGYYDAQDITQGGTRMLTTWTHPTAENPNSADTSYLHESAEVDWN